MSQFAEIAKAKLAGFGTEDLKELWNESDREMDDAKAAKDTIKYQAVADVRGVLMDLLAECMGDEAFDNWLDFQTEAPFACETYKQCSRFPMGCGPCHCTDNIN